MGSGVPRPPRPPATTRRIAVENIPAELKERPQWVAWRYESRDGRWTKVPYDVRSGKRAEVDDPATWAGFDEAIAAARANKHDGVGFVFSADDPYCGIDLDRCLDAEGRASPRARAIIDRLDSYTEVSPSRKGVKVWVRASLPIEGTGRRTNKVEGFGGIEMYHRSRFFTVTGWCFA